MNKELWNAMCIEIETKHIDFFSKYPPILDSKNHLGVIDYVIISYSPKMLGFENREPELPSEIKNDLLEAFKECNQ